MMMWAHISLFQNHNILVRPLFGISLFRYFVISLFRYFAISLFRYFVISSNTVSPRLETLKTVRGIFKQG